LTKTFTTENAEDTEASSGALSVASVMELFRGLTPENPKTHAANEEVFLVKIGSGFGCSWARPPAGLV